MKAVLIIIAVGVMAIWIAADLVWSRALAEREDKLKNDREILNGAKRNLELQRASLQARRDNLDKRVEEINTEYDIIGRERERLAKREGEFNEKAELLDTRAAELKDYKEAIDEMKVALVADYKKAKKK